MWLHYFYVGSTLYPTGDDFAYTGSCHFGGLCVNHGTASDGIEYTCSYESVL